MAGPLNPNQFNDHLHDMLHEDARQKGQRYWGSSNRRAAERQQAANEQVDRDERREEVLSSPAFVALHDGVAHAVQGVAQFLSDRHVPYDFRAEPLPGVHAPKKDVLVWTFLDFESGPRKRQLEDIPDNKPLGDSKVSGTAIDASGNEYELYGTRHFPRVRPNPHPLATRAYIFGNVNNDTSDPDLRVRPVSKTYPPFVDDVEELIQQAPEHTLRRYAALALESSERQLTQWALAKVRQRR